MNKKGFTLVEILVSISIVSILAVIGISVFNAAQKNNRDQARMRDLQAIKQALELYRSDNHIYPDTQNDLVDKYLSAWPADPVSGKVYAYAKTTTGFAVCAKGESLSSPACPVSLVCTTGGETCDLGLASD